MLAAATLLLCAARAPEQRTMHYKVTPRFWFDGAEAFQVELRFRGDADGETMLELPSAWAGSSELWRQVVGLEIRGARSLGGYYDRPIVRHAPGARLRVRYFVVSGFEGDPGFAYEKAKPIVRPDWFFWHGEGVFAHPQGRDTGPARFKWGKLPRGWAVASDLDHLNGGKTELANMINSVAIGGTRLRMVQRDNGGAPFRLAILGRWSFEPEQLADAIAPIVAAEDDFWGDRSSPFLVAMAPLGAPTTGLTYTGTGRTDAFSIASTAGFELKHAARFVAHEYMHSWVPTALGRLPGESEAVDHWFSEGFTDYLATKVLLRAGLWSPADYVEDKNETLLRYGTSPARNATAADIAARFWTDEAVRQISYDRGHLLATMLDGEISARADGARSLEAVLRVQRKAAEGRDALATDLFRTVLRDETGLDAATVVDRFARDGETIRLPEGLFAGCARLSTEAHAAFDRGYDADATRLADGVVAGVAPDGPAFAAGMRNGMRLLGREAGKIGDSRVEIAYRVADGDGERVVRYLPAGRRAYEVQQLILEEREPNCMGGAAR
jgi:predicted metalloprotease with PDZ domain